MERLLITSRKHYFEVNYSERRARVLVVERDGLAARLNLCCRSGPTCFVGQIIIVVLSSSYTNLVHLQQREIVL